MAGRPATVQMLYLIRDREYLRDNSGDHTILLATPLQSLTLPDDGAFWDGPVTPRIAVLDFDVQTGALRPGAKFLKQGIGKTVSSYAMGVEDLGPESSPQDFEDDGFVQISTFACVAKTLAYFEGPEILSRRIRWAFPSEQLLVVPRAGELRNAYYERESGSLQFFYERAADGHTVYTALSHDIVVHETTHAILDALAPDLYNAMTPQSLALHEAIVDLAAISQTLTNEMVLFSMDMLTNSQLDKVDLLSRLAEEFGSDLRHPDGASFLRRMKNSKTLNPAEPGADELGQALLVHEADPHALSQVLSGALFNVFENRIRNTTRANR